MGVSADAARSSTPHRWQYRFGLKFLLVTICLTAFVLAWFTREYRQAQRQTALVAELSSVGVISIHDEPNGLDLLVMKFSPKYERSLRERIGMGWLYRPTVFLCARLEDEKVPSAIERLRQLGTVREIHTSGPNLTQRGVAALQSGLPDVNVVPSTNPSLHHYFRDQVEHEHLATEGLQLAGLLILGILGIVAFFAWPLVRRRGMTVKPRPIAGDNGFSRS
jgi:hypothetical protein